MASPFGKYAVIDEVTHHFEKEPELWWKIRPVTVGMELDMSRFMVQARIQMDADGVRREYPPTTPEIMFRELALTFGGTNIPADPEKPVEGGGPAYLTLGLPIETIEFKLAQMPYDILLEVWNALADATSGWGPARPKVKPTSKASSSI